MAYGDTPKRIDLICTGRYEEAVVASAIKPGHAADFDSNRKIIPVAQANGTEPLVIVQEMSLVGKTINDAYAAADRARIRYALPGDEFYLRVPIAANVAKDDPLVYNGDGAFKVGSNFGSGLLFQVGPVPAATTMASMTTITQFTGASYTISANKLKVGDRIRFKAIVNLPNASNSTETVVITVKLGTVTVKANTALDNAANDQIVIEGVITITAVGASGTFNVEGTITSGAPGTAVPTPFIVTGSAVDTTADEALTVSQTCSASHANTGGQLRSFVVEGVSALGNTKAYALEAKDNSAGSDEAFVKARAA